MSKEPNNQSERFHEVRMNRRQFMLHSVAMTTASQVLPDQLFVPQPVASAADALLVEPSVATGARFWSHYPSDDFREPYLKRRWFIHDTEASVGAGQVLLTNPNVTTGAIMLKGCYDNRTASGEGGKPKVYLTWPWAM